MGCGRPRHGDVAAAGKRGGNGLSNVPCEICNFVDRFRGEAFYPGAPFCDTERKRKVGRLKTVAPARWGRRWRSLEV